MIHGRTAVLIKANIQHALVQMIRSPQATVIMVEINGHETVMGPVYQVVKDDFDTLIGLSKNKKFIFDGNLNCKQMH